MKYLKCQIYLLFLSHVILVSSMHATHPQIMANGVVPECEHFHMTDDYDFIALVWYAGRWKDPDQSQIKPVIIFASVHNPENIDNYQIDPQLPLIFGGHHMVHLKAERRDEYLYLHQSSARGLKDLTLNMLFENKENVINQTPDSPPTNQPATKRALWDTESRRTVINDYLLLATLASTDLDIIKTLNAFTNDVKLKNVTKCLLDNKEVFDHYKFFNVMIGNEEDLAKWLSTID